LYGTKDKIAGIAVEYRPRDGIEIILIPEAFT
jgi:hypothetical protein